MDPAPVASWAPLVAFIFLPFCYVSGSLEPTFQHCCQLGSVVAAQNRKCDEATSGSPVQGIPAEQQSVCLSTMQLCCVLSLRDIQCKEGKQVAERGLSCHSAKFEDSKYCCEACKLGMISGSMAMGCEFQEFSLGEMWDDTYRTCCASITPPAAAPAPAAAATAPVSPNFSTTTHAPASKPQRTSQSNENICDLLKGELCAHICVPTGASSYRCDCETGFVLMEDGKSCQQVKFISRCEGNNPCQQRCTDTGIAIECSCLAGFELAPDNKSCTDVDECMLGLHDCGQEQACHNEIGTFSCEDLPRLTQPPQRHTTNSGYNNKNNDKHVNNNTISSQDQGNQCPFGYIFNEDTQLCRDVDECEAELHVCSPEEVCVNMPGGYRCSPSQPTTTSQPIRCQSGYQYNDIYHRCNDIDECSEQDSPCDSNQLCENTLGSYSCNCKSGFQLDSITQACIDINECQVDLHNCLPSQRCDNTIGSFQCVRYTSCGTGYTLNAQTGLCEDNDECALHMCDHLGPGYKCRNTLGFFRCDKVNGSSPVLPLPTEASVPCDSCSLSTPSVTFRCPRGYFANAQRRCQDINECEKSDVCKTNQICINIPGGYICSNQVNCEQGFRLKPDTNRCSDIDECTEQPGLCDHKCHNSWGSYRCSCDIGYSLYQDNRTCVDINECEVFKDRRLCIGYCVNQPGSYTCQCPQGYRLGIDGASCQDIDECSSQNVCTGRNEVCLNMRGAHRCVSTACPPDYIKDSQHTNRCKRITMSCHEGDMECLQKPLTYTFHFITLVSNLTRSSGPVDLFMMRGPMWSSTNVQFDLQLDKVNAVPSVRAATLQSFRLEEADHNVANIRLLQPIIGPQDIYLQLYMKFFYNGIYGGTTISNIAIFVSQYEF